MIFFAGWLTLGALWFPGALLADAADSPEVRKRSALAIAATAAGFLALGLFGARPTVVLGMNGHALQSAVGGYGVERDGCSRKGEGWICARYVPEGSSVVRYRVDVDGAGCWTATRMEVGGGKSPKHVSGCATLIDFVLG